MQKILLFLAWLILILTFTTGCWPSQSATTPEPIGQEKTTEQNEQPVIENKSVAEEKPLSCEEWAKTLFPEQWVFSQDVTDDPKLTGEILSLREGKWKDGAMIRGTSSTKIMLGSAKGENLNYYYAKPMYPGLESKYGFTYSEEIIDNRGNIFGDNTFTIRPVFKVLADLVKNESNPWGYEIMMRHLSLLMVEPNFVSCERV